jgi:hypothetical protein
MYQPSAARSEDKYQAPPSPAVSFAFAALTAALVVLVSIVVTAPAVVAAFGAGALTAVAVTLLYRVHVESHESRVLTGSRSAHR